MEKEINIKGWDNKVIPHEKVNYPQSKDEHTPRIFFVGIWAGTRKTGKTFLTCKLLKALEKKGIVILKLVAQRIILISPTAHSDSNKILRTLKYLNFENDVYTDYADGLIGEIRDAVLKDIEEARKYEEYKKHI